MNDLQGLGTLFWGFGIHFMIVGQRGVRFIKIYKLKFAFAIILYKKYKLVIIFFIWYLHFRYYKFSCQIL